MGVYTVTLIAPNGNRVSRPIAAYCAQDAINIMEAEHGIEDAAAEGIDVEAKAEADPDGRYERNLRGMD